jgi:hypothetical protein
LLGGGWSLQLESESSQAGVDTSGEPAC